MKILSRGRIPKPTNEEQFNSNCFPCMVKLPSGRWLASFRAAEKKSDPLIHKAVLTWSDDEGANWVKPFEAVPLPAIKGVTGLSLTSYFLPLSGSKVLMVTNWVDGTDMTQPFYNPETESLKDTKIFFAVSENDGESWSEPKLMDTSPIDAPLPLTGAPLLLKDGVIACHFEVNKYESDPNPWIHRSCMIFSRDGGSTWGEVVEITNHPDMYYWDQRPNVMADGTTIVNYFWTLDGKQQTYLNIHASISRDAGKTWSHPWDTGIYGQPGVPVDLRDGRIATIDIDRSIRPIITVRTSRDYGKTYEESIVVYDTELVSQDSKQMTMNDAWAEMAKFSVGHPYLLWLGNNEILAYFYAGSHTDHTHIEYVRLKV